MAKNRSIIEFRGTLGELTFYETGGQKIVKRKSSVSSSKIKNDPAFKRTRENNQEFGGAAKAGKSLRMGFASISKTMADRYFVPRLTAIMRSIISRGTGPRGQREFLVTNSSDLLTGFEFNDKQVFDSVLFAPSTINLNADRTEITWNLPDFPVDDFINASPGATHFRLVLAAGILSDFAYSAAESNYIPVSPEVNEIAGIQFGNFQELIGQSGTIDLLLNLNTPVSVPATASVNIATGIIFYQEINGNMYELNSGNAMKIARVAL